MILQTIYFKLEILWKFTCFWTGPQKSKLRILHKNSRKYFVFFTADMPFSLKVTRQSVIITSHRKPK